MWLPASGSLWYGTPCTAVSDRRLDSVTRLLKVNFDGAGTVHHGVGDQFADHQRGVADYLRVQSTNSELTRPLAMAGESAVAGRSVNVAFPSDIFHCAPARKRLAALSLWRHAPGQMRLVSRPGPTR